MYNISKWLKQARAKARCFVVVCHKSLYPPIPLATNTSSSCVDMEGSSLSEDMTVTDVVSWLSCQGFKDDIQQIALKVLWHWDACVCSAMCCNVVAQEMDGEALFGAVGCQVGPDCLKDILPKFGQRIKVYRAIRLRWRRHIYNRFVKEIHLKGNLF